MQDNSNEKVTFVSIDVETPNPQNDAICSFGMFFADENNGCVKSLYTLIDPETHFSEPNISIHGITEKDVVDSPVFPDLWDKVGKYIENCFVIGHHVTFDLNCIRKAIFKHKIKSCNIRYFDTYDIAKFLQVPVEDYRLTTLCHYFDIPIEEHHNALEDAKAAYFLFLKFIEVYDIDLAPFEKNCDFSKRPSKSKKTTVVYSDVTIALQELKDILAQITADGVVDDSEIAIMNIWLKHHEMLKGNYPYDDIEAALKKVLKKKAVTEKDRKYLFDLFDEFVNPFNKNSPEPQQIEIKGSLICLSGNFETMSKIKLAALLEQRGAIVKNNVVQSLDYLVVGGLGNEQWALGNYGTKVKKALQFNNRGFNIKIVGEEDFIKIL